MGSCKSKSEVRLESEHNIEIPRCFYYCRRKHTLFEISNTGISKYSMKDKIASHPDSCIGVVGDNEIVVLGGSDPRGGLSRRVFHISTSKKSATELPPLPRGSKEGNLLESNGFYYYIGGTVEAEDQGSPFPEEGSSIMRYDIKKKKWEEFANNVNDTECLSSGLNKKFIEDEKKEEANLSEPALSLRNLTSAGAFTYNGRIYLVGGKIVQDGKYHPTDKIFSVGIENEGFDLREESLKLPIKLVNPVCASGGTHAFITGGCFENNQPSMKMFVIKLSKNEVHECHAKLDSAIEEFYPPGFLENEVVLFSTRYITTC